MEELDALARVEKSNILEILEFVPLHSIPSPLRDRTYYLGPDKGRRRTRCWRRPWSVPDSER